MTDDVVFVWLPTSRIIVLGDTCPFEQKTRDVMKRKEPPKSASEPRPVAAPGSSGDVSYLTEEQKASLNAKYGTIQLPSEADMQALAKANCKMQ